MAAKEEGGGRPGSGPRQRPRRALGVVDAVTALVILLGVWGGLPARWWPVDAAGTLLAALLLVAGYGLFRGEPWARRVGIAAGGVALALGAGLVTTLALTASYLAGLYGPVGQGGALLLLLVALFAVPYLVVFPAAQLFALARSPGDDA